MTYLQSGKALRLTRLTRHGDGRYLFIPLDHSVSDGPVASAPAFNDLVMSLVTSGADAVIVHRGRVRTIRPALLAQCALIIHLSVSTRHAPDTDAKVLVGSVEEAVRLGADAVSVHVNIGSATEAQQLADMGTVAMACDRWGIPLLAMIYLRGPRITDPHDPETLAHVVNVAADLGADLVKTTCASPTTRMAEVVVASPIPVLVAGGAADGADLTLFARTALAAGCHGLAVGRKVFRHPSPADAVRELANIVHEHATEPFLMSTSARALAGSL